MSGVQYESFLESVAKRHLAREEIIGTTRRVVELLSQGAVHAAPRPVVSLKTLYTDFEVRELAAFYGNGAPLQLELGSSKAGAHEPAAVTAPVVAQNGTKRPRVEESDAAVVDSSSSLNNSEETATGASAPVQGKSASAVPEAIGPLVSDEDLAALLAGLAAEAKSIPLSSVTDKEKRAELHKAIKACLGGTHVSNTADGVVCVVKATAADRREERRRSRTHRPPPMYHHFTLYKENTDSNQALRMIANHLRLSSRQLQFCGTKDKRAVTLQRVAIRETTVERLKSINERVFGAHNTIKVCSFTQEEHGLRLGDANGNHFRIVLRAFPGPVALAAEHLREVERVVRAVGVINYFGPQRFGTTDVLTSDVGVQFLQGNLREGLRLLLISRASMVPEMQKAVELFDAHNYAEALSAAPYYCYQERDILKHLTSNPNDYLGALQSMARTMAMMYFHAVQSLVWNCMASARLSGPDRMHVEVGDLVLESTYQRRRAGNGEDSVVDSAASPLGSTLEEDGKLPLVHTLTDDDDCSRFSLADVMLPVPGPDQELVYPTSAGCSHADYQTVLDRLQVDFASKEALSLIKIFHFHGTYRAVGVQPKEFELCLQTVESWRTPVLRSDWELHCEREGIKTPSSAVAVTEEAAASEPQGAVQAVVATFSLPPGSYATSVLREFCIPSTETYRGADAEQDA